MNWGIKPNDPFWMVYVSDANRSWARWWLRCDRLLWFSLGSSVWGLIMYVAIYQLGMVCQ